jgi:hypothetical protein
MPSDHKGKCAELRPQSGQHLVRGADRTIPPTHIYTFTNNMYRHVGYCHQMLPKSHKVDS